METDWKQRIRRDDIDLIDVCTPGESHAEIAIAALEAGKHVFCEKPLANTVSEAQAMVAAAEQASAKGVRSMVAFNYRRVPALALAKRLVEQGRLGTIRRLWHTFRGAGVARVADETGPIGVIMIGM